MKVHTLCTTELHPAPKAAVLQQKNAEKMSKEKRWEGGRAGNPQETRHKHKEFYFQELGIYQTAPSLHLEVIFCPLPNVTWGKTCLVQA